MKDRQRFNMLLMGQGGSGKTALIQEIVLPTMDFCFPPDEGSDASSSLIVCAKWSQAANISTVAHKGFAAITNSCGLQARRLAAELGLEYLLRD